MWNKIVQMLGFRQSDENNEFSMNTSGRSGTITYHSGEYQIEIDYEMSGSPDTDILIAPIDLREWSKPKGCVIPKKVQIEILSKLRSWANAKKLKTDIDLPLKLEFEDSACLWVGCNEKKIKDSAYCEMHYNENLLKK